MARTLLSACVGVSGARDPGNKVGARFRELENAGPNDKSALSAGIILRVLKVIRPLKSVSSRTRPLKAGGRGTLRAIAAPVQ